MAGNQHPIKLEFYRGLKRISELLGIKPRTAAKYIKAGKIPAKKDATGCWVLSNLDYLNSLDDS